MPNKRFKSFVTKSRQIGYACACYRKLDSRPTPLNPPQDSTIIPFAISEPIKSPKPIVGPCSVPFTLKTYICAALSRVNASQEVFAHDQPHNNSPTLETCQPNGPQRGIYPGIPNSVIFDQITASIVTALKRVESYIRFLGRPLPDNTEAPCYS